LSEDLRGVEFQDLRGVMVDPDDGVEKAHGNAPLEAMPDGLAD